MFYFIFYLLFFLYFSIFSSDNYLLSGLLEWICSCIIYIYCFLEACFVPYMGASGNVIQLCSDWSNLHWHADHNHLSDEYVYICMHCLFRSMVFAWQCLTKIPDGLKRFSVKLHLLGATVKSPASSVTFLLLAGALLQISLQLGQLHTLRGVGRR